MMQVQADCLHPLHQHHLFYHHSPAFHDFPSPSSSSSCISPVSYLDHHLLLPLHDLDVEALALPFPVVDAIDDVSGWLTEDCQSDRHPASDDSGCFGGVRESCNLVFPGEDAEVDARSGVFHLIRACGEAEAKEQEALLRVILTRLKDGCSPAGSALQRMTYHFVNSYENDRWDDHDRLARESLENSAEAFCAFYQAIPVGKFAHLVANSAILDLVPDDASGIHVVDFDIEEGVQWAPLIYEIATRGWRSLRLTSAMWARERERFRETEGRLRKLASSLGVKLAMEEIGIESLAAELRKSTRTGEFLAFNCMLGLPHMRSSGLGASRAAEFLTAAKGCINILGGNRGIILLGDSMGLEEESSKAYGSFLESKLVQTQTLFEAMEFHFQENFMEARIAMECLFLGPNMKSQVRYREWEEIAKASSAISLMGLRPRTMRETQAAEAKQMVGEGESPYWVRAGGGSGNEMSLNYLGTKLATVSCWN